MGTVVKNTELAGTNDGIANGGCGSLIAGQGPHKNFGKGSKVETSREVHTAIGGITLPRSTSNVAQGREPSGIASSTGIEHCFFDGTTSLRCDKNPLGKYSPDPRQSYEHNVCDCDTLRGKNGGAIAALHHTPIAQITGGTDVGTHAASRATEGRVDICRKNGSLHDDSGGHERSDNREQEVHPAQHTERGSTTDGATGARTLPHPAIFETHLPANARQIPRLWSGEFGECQETIEGRGAPTNWQYKLRPPREWTQWPLHVKPVEKRSWIQSPPAFSTTRRAAIFEYFRQFFMKNKLSQVPKKTTTTVDLSNEDIQRLLEANLLEETNEADLSFALGMHLFAVPEVMKVRRRFICHTVDINEWWPTVSLPEDIALPKPEEIYNNHRPRVMCVDAKAYYQQFQLPVESRKFFSFRVGGKIYRLTTIATGQRQCVPLAQTLAVELAHSAEETQPYIDNFRTLPASDADLEKMTKDFYRRADELGITISEPIDDAIIEEYDFIGAHFMVGNLVTLTEKTRRKLQQMASDLSRDVVTRPWQEIQSMFGLLIQASRLFQMSLCDYYYAFKFIRRHGARFAKGEIDAKTPLTIWASTLDIWRQWVKKLANHEPRQVSSPKGNNENRVVLVTDASDTGWGAVLFRGDEVIYASGTFNNLQKTMNIAEREFQAVINALLAFNITNEKVILFVDNTTVKGIIGKDRSKSYFQNKRVQLLQRYDIVQCHYVASASNVADALSRGRSPITTQVSWWREMVKTILPTTSSENGMDTEGNLDPQACLGVDTLF